MRKRAGIRHDSDALAVARSEQVAIGLDSVSSRASWRLQNANTDSGHRRVGRNNCGACHPHRTARPACGRNTDSAKALRRSGLRVSGIGGEVRADDIDVAAIEDYGKGDQFDLILLATKAQDALEVAPHVLGPRRGYIAYTEWRRCTGACRP